MDALHSLILDAPMGAATILVSVILFMHALMSGIRFTTLERQRNFLLQQKLDLETELENMRLEIRGLRLWQNS